MFFFNSPSINNSETISDTEKIKYSFLLNAYINSPFPFSPSSPSAAAAIAFPSDKIKIAKTTKEYMSTCLTTGKTADECMHNTCPMCQETFMKNGHLVRPVMFHKSHDSKNKEMWVDPVHPEEQVRWGTQCMGCREQLGITNAQLKAIASESVVIKLPVS